MSRFGGPLLIGVALAAAFAGCSGGGVGVNECRTIEEARCSAAANCDVGLESASKRLQCNRYSKDDCLHGLPGDVPHPSVLDACVKAIKAAGRCAGRDGGDSLASGCTGVGTPASSKTTVCDVVDAPEASSECGFLTTTPVKEQPKEAGSDEPKDAGGD